MLIESSLVVSVHPDWPAQTPQGSGNAGSNGLAVWVPGASRSPITSNEGLTVGIGVAVRAALGAEGVDVLGEADTSPNSCPVVQPVMANDRAATTTAPRWRFTLTIRTPSRPLLPH